MVVKTKSRVMGPPALVSELEEGAQTRCFLASAPAVKLIYTAPPKIKMLKLLRRGSSIKMARPAIDSISRGNS